jgi:hypothetical protein
MVGRREALEVFIMALLVVSALIFAQLSILC